MNHRPFRYDGHLNQQSAVGKPVFPPKKGEKDLSGTGESILRVTYAIRVFHETLNHMAQRAAIGNMLLVY